MDLDELLGMMAEASAMDTDLESFEDADVRAFTLIQDLRQDVIMVLDEQGMPVETYRYDLHGLRWADYQDGSTCVPFADRRDPGGRIPDLEAPRSTPCISRVGNPLGWQGSRLSAVTGTYDMRARHYDPRLRVFLSRDPLGWVDSFDVWLYAAGDPLGMWDPWGLKGVPTLLEPERGLPHRAGRDYISEFQDPFSQILDAASRAGLSLRPEVFVVRGFQVTEGRHLYHEELADQFFHAYETRTGRSREEILSLRDKTHPGGRNDQTR